MESIGVIIYYATNAPDSNTILPRLLQQGRFKILHGYFLLEPNDCK